MTRHSGEVERRLAPAAGASGYGGELQFPPSHSRWCFGWDWGVAPAFRDPHTGRPLTRTSESTNGPIVHYRFGPHARNGWYAGALLLRWSRVEKSLAFGDSRTASTTYPYIGGGMSRFAKHLSFNGGFFIAPTAQLTTQTSPSSTESSGNFA
jgi:hypothetical protein